MFQRKTIRLTMAMVVFAALMSIGRTGWTYTPGACREDGEKLCPGLTGKALTPCLKQHETELSTPCKVNLAEAREMVRQTKDACEPDIQKFCAGVQTGQGRIRRCLKAHEAELSAGCKSQIAVVRKKYQVEPPAAEPAAPSPAAK